MPKVKVRLLKKHKNFLPGETVEISKRDLKPLVAMGRVELVDENAAPPVKATPRKRVAPKPAPRQAKVAPAALQSEAKAAPTPRQSEGKVVSAMRTSEPKPVEAPARTEHVRRDITATESPSIDKLREQYRRRFHHDPDQRWGIPRLTQELAAGSARGR